VPPGNPDHAYFPVTATTTFGDYTLEADPVAAENYVMIRNDSRITQFGVTDQLLVSLEAFAPAAPKVGTFTLNFVSVNLLGASNLWETDSLPRVLPPVSSFQHFNLAHLSFSDGAGVLLFDLNCWLSTPSRLNLYSLKPGLLLVVLWGPYRPPEPS
jgi:hypothetical protein